LIGNSLAYFMDEVTIIEKVEQGLNLGRIRNPGVMLDVMSEDE
jgi:hypothetical protein